MSKPCSMCGCRDFAFYDHDPSGRRLCVCGHPDFLHTWAPSATASDKEAKGEKAKPVLEISFAMDQLRNVLSRTEDIFPSSNKSTQYMIIERVVRLLNREEKTNELKAFSSKVMNAKSCTAVYYACGTCGENGALVEYYCDGGGSGSQPDFIDCEPC